MRIAIVGAGHVGLVSAATFAHIGHDVLATDSDETKLSVIRSGVAGFYEPGLQELMLEGTASGRLSFVDSVAEAVAGAAVAFICVGTPPRGGGAASLVAVEQSARAIGQAATGPLVVVEKSTVPAGTAERMRTILTRAGPDIEFHVVSNPEFLREGSAVADSLRPERILIGAESDEGLLAMREVYAPMIDAGVPLIETNVATAEVSKHAANAFLALKVSFINAVARVCENVGADVRDVAGLLGSDPRIGRAMLDAGIGFGGSCFHKDLQAFDQLAGSTGYDFPLLREVIRLNDQSVEAVVDRVEHLLWNLEGKRILLLGLAFKPGTDDVRFAPALELARRLIERGAHLVGHDPQANAAAKAEVPELEITDDVYRGAEGASCLILCTEWEEFTHLDFARLRVAVQDPYIVDGRNLLDEGAARAEGFTYVGIGRPLDLLPR